MKFIAAGIVGIVIISLCTSKPINTVFPVYVNGNDKPEFCVDINTQKEAPCR